ncbi:unknown [Bacteroides sp. CAG:1060]|nr:unknown [Bacteroides sp. CAG:1060]
MIVFAFGISILIRYPVKSLKHLARICTERSRCGRSFLLALRRLLHFGHYSGAGSFPLRSLGGKFLFGIGKNPLAVTHYKNFLSGRISSSDNPFPLVVEFLVRILLVWPYCHNDITVRRHFTQKTAHLQAVVHACAVGIEDNRKLSAIFLCRSSKVLRTINNMCRQTGITHSNGLERSGTAVFDYLPVSRLSIAGDSQKDGRRSHNLFKIHNSTVFNNSR